MKRYKLVFSIPIHERLEVVIDQILNIKCCNQDSAIVYHFSPSYKDSNSYLPKDSFIKIIDNIGDVYVNPVSVRTGMDDIIQAHLSNYEFIAHRMEFDYFCICASNESFIKRGLYEHINKYDGGASQDSVKGWIYEKELEHDTDFQSYLKKNDIKSIKYTYPEGQDFRYDIIADIHKMIVAFYEYQNLKTVYPRDEIFYSTFLGHLKEKNPNIKIGKTFAYSAYHLSHLFNVTRLNIKYSLLKDEDVYSAKRVDRNINDSIRVYLRRELGYYEEEQYLLKDVCLLENYTDHQIDLMDLKKFILPLFRNLNSILSRFGLAPRKKGKMPC